MPAKHCMWVLSGILASSSIIAQTQDQPGDLGYRTDGYELGQGNTHSGPPTDYGHAHFTKPRYGNSTYYRSYHAHKDVIKDRGGDVYSPWQWNPYYYHDYGYPLPDRHYQHQQGVVTGNTWSSSDPVERRLEQTLDGRCFELKRSNATELRVELPAEQCAIASTSE